MSREKIHNAVTASNNECFGDRGYEGVKGIDCEQAVQQPDDQGPNVENAIHQLKEHLQDNLQEENVQTVEERSPTRIEKLQMTSTDTVVALAPYKTHERPLGSEETVNSVDRSDQKSPSENLESNSQVKPQQTSSPRQYARDMRRQANEKSGIDDPVTHTGYDQIEPLETILEEDEKPGGG